MIFFCQSYNTVKQLLCYKQTGDKPEHIEPAIQVSSPVNLFECKGKKWPIKIVVFAGIGPDHIHIIGYTQQKQEHKIGNKQCVTFMKKVFLYGFSRVIEIAADKKE